MDKQVIGFFRIVLFFVLFGALGVPSDPFEYKLMISDLIHGGHSAELRNSTSVSIIMAISLGVISFYIIQSLAYIFVGSALNGRNTSIFNFFRHVFKSLGEMRNDPHFWTSDSASGGSNSLDKVMSYRDNKMAMMNNADAAELMKKTSHIDAARANPDLPQSKKVLSYLNNKVALMDNKSALEYLQNGK